MSILHYEHTGLASKCWTATPSSTIDYTGLFPKYFGTEGSNTPNAKMGYCELGVQNTVTPVSANETYLSSNLNIRRNAEYFQDYITSDVYFVNKKGQIGFIPIFLSPDKPPQWLENCPNYFSWNAGVDPASLSESIGMKGMAYAASASMYDIGNDSVKHSIGGHSLKRPFFENEKGDSLYFGFQTSENTCSIYHRGRCVFRGPYDGRRFPVAYNYRDGRFFDYRHPDQDMSGVCQGLWPIPALDQAGKILWTMPKVPVVYENSRGIISISKEYFDRNNDGIHYADIEGIYWNDVNPGRLPSPIPVLNPIPLNLSLIWHWWTAIDPMSIVKGGIADHPHTQPGYYALGYKRFISFSLVDVNACPEVDIMDLLDGGDGGVEDSFHGVPLGTISAADSTFVGLKGGAQVFETVPLSVERGLWLMTVACQSGGLCTEANKCDDCGGGMGICDVPRNDMDCSSKTSPSCGHYRVAMAVRIADDDGKPCVYYDFAKDANYKDVVPLHNQIRGFESNGYDITTGMYHLVTKRQLFTSIQESRRITSRKEQRLGPIEQPLRPLPLDWSLANEIQSDVLNRDVFTKLEHTSEYNRLSWWYKYIETFYVYQCKPLSTSLVHMFSDSTPDGWKRYDKPDNGFFTYANDVAGQQFMQIKDADMKQLGCYVPSWINFRHYKLKKIESIAVDDIKVYHPKPWYTFRFDGIEGGLLSHASDDGGYYYTAVINRSDEGNKIPISISSDILPEEDNKMYTTSTKTVRMSDGSIKTIERKVLDVMPVSTDFTINQHNGQKNNGERAVYGITPFDVVEVGNSSRPASWSSWWMYDGAQMFKGNGCYQEYLDYSRKEHRMVLSLDYQVDDTGTRKTTDENTSPFNDTISWDWGGGTISGDQGNAIGVGNKKLHDYSTSFVSSDGGLPANESNTLNSWESGNSKNNTWTLYEPHTNVEYYEDFIYVKGLYYRRLYFKGKPVPELPTSWALLEEDNIGYEFALITKNEFVLYYPIGGGADAYCLQVWGLTRGTSGRILSIQSLLTHYFIGVEQYAALPSTIVISEHYLCFATQIYWREVFRMIRKGDITVYDNKNIDSRNIVDYFTNVNPRTLSQRWRERLDTTDEETGITVDGIPIMRKTGKYENGDDVYSQLDGQLDVDGNYYDLGFYSVNTIPANVYVGTASKNDDSGKFENLPDDPDADVRIVDPALYIARLSETINNRAVPNLHKFVCFYRSCPGNDFEMVNPSGEPEFVPKLCYSSSGGVRMNISITREFATIWDTFGVVYAHNINGDPVEYVATGRGIKNTLCGDARFPLMVYKGQWISYPHGRYIGDYEEFIFDTEEIVVENDGQEQWKRQLSLVYSYGTSIKEHLRIIYWKVPDIKETMDEYEIEDSSADYYGNLVATPYSCHIIVGNVPWHWKVAQRLIGANSAVFEWTWQPTLRSDGDKIRFVPVMSAPWKWAFNRPDVGGKNRVVYSIIDETEWRLWFNHFRRIDSEGLHGEDVKKIYPGIGYKSPPFGKYKFEAEVFCPRVEDIDTLVVKQAIVERYKDSRMGEICGYNSGSGSGVSFDSGVIMYESHVFPNENKMEPIHVYETWILYGSALFIRDKRGWIKIPLPYNGVKPKEQKSCDNSAAGEVDRVLLFILEKHVKEGTLTMEMAGLYIKRPSGNGEWVWGELRTVTSNNSGSASGSGLSTNLNEQFDSKLAVQSRVVNDSIGIMATADSGSGSGSDSGSTPGSTPGSSSGSGSGSDSGSGSGFGTVYPPYTDERFNIPCTPVIDGNIEYVDGGVLVKKTFTEYPVCGEFGSLNCRVVNVFFRDGKVEVISDGSNETSAADLECCEWYEWSTIEYDYDTMTETNYDNYAWRKRRHAGMSCSQLGVTVKVTDKDGNAIQDANGNDIEKVNPMFAEKPLVPEDVSSDFRSLIYGGSDIDDETPMDSTVKDSKFPRTVSCDNFLKLGSPCADGSDCGEGGIVQT